jgi:hypothetical protein
MDELAQRITEYAATVDEANKRTLDPYRAARLIPVTAETTA